MIRIAYFGSPAFSAELLRKLVLASEHGKGFLIDLVVCPPDKPAGRGLALQKSPTKQAAEELHIAIFDVSAKQNSQQLINILSEKKIDICLVFAYGEIIDSAVLGAIKGGFINVHPSLLPRFRGPNPVGMPLLLDEKETGVTLIQMDEHMDTGNILFQKKFLIPTDATPQSVLTQAVTIAFEEIVKLFGSDIKISSKPQNSSQATYTKLLKRDDGCIPADILSEGLNLGYVSTSNLSVYTKYLIRNRLTTSQIPRHVSLYTFWKALQPWPGVWTIISHDGVEKRLKILTVDSSNQMKILKVQLEGKQPISWDEFTLNYSLQ